jgi:hypothetical protein
MPPLALTELTQACSPARCSGCPEGPEKLPIVPMTRSDPDEATAGLELAAAGLVLPPGLLLLLLLQAVARAATATLSADARSSAVLRAFYITGSDPQEAGTVTAPPGAASGERWRGGSRMDDDWTVSRSDPDHHTVA